MAIEPVKIPQNVYVEDRIIGPVTLKQLAMVGIGMGISYALFATANKDGAAGIPISVACWTPAVVAAAFAFLRIHDLTLFNIILLMIEHTNKPNLRYWSPHQGISINFVSKAFKQAVIDANTKINENANKLAELTRQLERREEELTKLANHIVVPSSEETAPGGTPPPGRRLDGIGILPTAEHVEASEGGSEPSAPAGEPVNADAVQAQGNNQGRTIDGVTKAEKLEAFKHIFPPS